MCRAISRSAHDENADEQLLRPDRTGRNFDGGSSAVDNWKKRTPETQGKLILCGVESAETELLPQENRVTVDCGVIAASIE